MTTDHLAARLTLLWSLVELTDISIQRAISNEEMDRLVKEHLPELSDCELNSR